jgi:hypothetical protein
MRISSLLEPSLIKPLYEQRKTLALEGPPGVGKSSVIRQIPATLSKIYGETFGFYEVLAPTVDASDVRGLCGFHTEPDGTLVSKYTRSALLPSKEYFAAHPRGVYFIDEYAQADILTAKAFSPTLLEGKLGEESLPEGWIVMIAYNRAQDQSGASRMLRQNTNRCRVFEITGDESGWCNWAEKQDELHPMGIAFVKRFSGSVFADEVPSKSGPFCTQRSFTSMLQFLKLVSGNSMVVPDSPIIREACAGDVGKDIAHSFFAFAKNAEILPSLEEILAKPDTAKVPELSRMDACYIAMRMCINNFSPETIEPLWTYTLRLPKELQATAVRELVRSKPQLLLQSPRLKKWRMENKELLEASVANE